MKPVRFAVIAFALTLAAFPAWANEGHTSFDGTLGAGYENLSVQGPANNFKINNGTTFNIQGEKSFGGTPFYLNVGLNYLQTSGNLNYFYSSPTATYAANMVNYADNDFQLNVGLRLKFFDGHPIRPYVEAGALAGYMQISYDSSLRTPAVLAAGTDYKTLDTALEFGYYAEAGFEFQVGQGWGIRLGAHYVNSGSKALVTLNNQSVSYTGMNYYGGIFWDL